MEALVERRIGLTFVQEMLDYIEENLLCELTLNHVAERFFINVNLANQLFRLVFDMTIMEYVRYRRLSLVAKDIMTSDLSIIQAALKYGYETPEAFSKAFTRFHGFPPSLLRRIYPKIKVFSPYQIKLEIHGGFALEEDNINLTKQIDSTQESSLDSRYNNSMLIKGGVTMGNQRCEYHINSKDMIYKEDWGILLELVKKLKEAGLVFKVDGKTMIFAHGLEFKLEKICLTFQWKQEQKVLEFFDETGVFSESCPGFKYYDTKFMGMKIRCLLYEDFPGSDTKEILYENTDLVEVDGVQMRVQSLEFFYLNAEPDPIYYKMVEDYIKHKNEK